MNNEAKGMAKGRVEERAHIDPAYVIYAGIVICLIGTLGSTYKTREALQAMGEKSVPSTLINKPDLENQPVKYIPDTLSSNPVENKYTLYIDNNQNPMPY